MIIRDFGLRGELVVRSDLEDCPKKCCSMFRDCHCSEAKREKSQASAFLNCDRITCNDHYVASRTLHPRYSKVLMTNSLNSQFRNNMLHFILQFNDF